MCYVCVKVMFSSSQKRLCCPGHPGVCGQSSRTLYNHIFHTIEAIFLFSERLMNYSFGYL